MAERKPNRARSAQQVNIGDKFNRWKVVGQPERHKGWKWKVLCLCECGTERLVLIEGLLNGHSKSCGCWKAEVAQRQGRANRTHGETKTAIYGVWQAMIRRCENESDVEFHNYGGRGVRVCHDWRSSFEAFRDWAVSAGWKRGLQIDRFPDMDGNYEPSNCRVATPTQNANNTRRNRKIEAFGERKTLAEWSRDERCAVGRETVAYRLNAGWEPEAAITTEAGPTSHA